MTRPFPSVLPSRPGFAYRTRRNDCGLVGAACVILWEAAVHTSADAMVFCFALTLAVYFGIQAPIVVILGGIMGALLHEDVIDLGQVDYCERY